MPRYVWFKLTNEQLVEYSKEHALFGLSPKEGRKKDSRYYDAVYRRKLVDTIFLSKHRKRRNWKEMTDDDLIEYGKQSGLFGIQVKNTMLMGEKQNM